MKTILVLEDDPSVMRIIRLVLSKEYIVVECATAAKAVQRFHEHSGNIDLLITDVFLPVSSGTHVAIELRSHNPAVGIILTSAYHQSMWPDPECAEFNELPPVSRAMLPKPFFPSELLKIVNAMTGPSVEFPSGETGCPYAVHNGTQKPG